MATSLTYDSRFNTRRLIDRAIGRCKLRPQLITAEKIDIAKDNLWLILSSLVNRGVQLWAIEKLILPLYEAKDIIPLPTRTVDILNANFRTTTRLTGTDTSSDGGTVNNAFDNDFATTCTQTAPNGNLQTLFSTATQVTTVGVLAGATTTWDLAVESSDDGITWVERLDIGPVEAVSGEWLWYDIDSAPNALYWRLRTAEGTLAVTELYWGNNPAEIPFGRLNLDDYAALPNKTFQGQPNSIYFDRQRTNPPINIWPVTNQANRYAQATVWIQRYLQDVGTLTQELDIPQRWFMAIVDRLAHEVAREFEEVPRDFVNDLKGYAESSWTEAQNEERDNSPIMFTPAIGVYNR